MLTYFNIIVNALKNKKVLIYGTGVWCHRLIEWLKDTSVIVGILDREKTEGQIDGIPILQWKNLRHETADAVIIASRPQFYKEIYTRICGNCFQLGLSIYSADGQDLKIVYDKPAVDIDDAVYYAKTKEKLLAKIKEYDAVSFDVFDTLVMRKVLESADIFDLVEERLRKKEIIINDFKKERIASEQSLGVLGSGNINLDAIYDVLQSRLNLDNETCRIIKEEELLCEQENLIPRQAVLEVFRSAVEQKKIVSLISDMYIPGEILSGILEKLGITGYSRLYVSCDYRKLKTEGLFADYRKDVGGLHCLHIGDNFNADILAPRQFGIDTYEIWSAHRMLEKSSLSRILLYASSTMDRFFLGYFIADVLNDPFSLHDYPGIVRIDTAEQFASFFVPLIMLYMNGLYELLDTGKFDTILFSSRDCYLMKKIYDAEILHPKKENVRSVYFYTSRVLALKAAFDTAENIINYAEYLKSPEMFSKHLNRMYTKDVAHVSGNGLYIDIDAIKNESSVTKTNYLHYIQEHDLCLNTSSLFCDLISSGTVHFYLNKMMKTDMQGFYLATTVKFSERKLPVVSCYDNWNIDETGTKLLHFVEKIITAPEPSVTEMDSAGKPVYSDDYRSEQDIRDIVRIQNSICLLLKKISTSFSFYSDFTPVFARKFIELCSSVFVTADLCHIFSYCSPDDLGPQRLEILSVHFSE